MSMFNYIRKHPFLTTSLPLLAAWGIISCLMPRALANDDFQLWFMYCNGGTGAVPFSMHSGVLEGWLLMALNALSDQVNWYLILLHLICSAACLGLNLHATTRCCSNTSSTAFDAARWIILLVALTFINFHSIYHAQYTYIAIMCACVSLFLFYDWLKGLGGTGRLIGSLLLFCCAYELRDQAMAAFAILWLGACGAWLLSHRSMSEPKRGLCILLYPLLLAALVTTDKLAFQAVPEWHEAKQFCLARIGIQDSRDNSGINKAEALAEIGIDKRDYDVFKTFTYVPGFCQESAEKIAQARDIHQSQRRGLLGLDLAARAGILALDDYRFKGGSTLLKSLDPWIPLGLGVCLLVFGCNKRALLHALPMLGAVLLYFGVLLLLQRAVDRVLNPVLYAGGIWLIASPTTSNKLSRLWLSSTCFALLGLLVACFPFRHARWYTTAPEQAWKYCAERPQNLYLTASMQDLGIFPAGWAGISKAYLSRSNIIPISDGWCFYSPAYRQALQARHISNPYAEILKPGTFIITQNNLNQESMLQLISLVHQRQCGTALEFQQVETVGKFTFWKAKAKS